jgi:hypothetical protein
MSVGLDPLYVCRYDQRHKTKSETSTLLTYTGFVVYYESRKREIKIRLMKKIETRLITEMSTTRLKKFLFVKNVYY